MSPGARRGPVGRCCSRPSHRPSARIVTTDRQRTVKAHRDRSEFDATPDTLRWYRIGYPAPGTTRADGRPVLELRGDGRYSDGIMSRTSSKVPAGFTVEMEIQAPQTRPEYQGFGVWIQHAAPPEDTTAFDRHAAWLHGDR